MEFDDNAIVVLSILILMLTLVVMAVLSRKRKVPFGLRSIAAYGQAPLLIGRAIEADRPLHLSLGSAGIGGSNTLVALAGAEMAYQLTRRATIGDRSPLVTFSDASALPVGQDVLSRAFNLRGASHRYHPTNARWYPDGRRSLAFAAAITALISDERVAGNVMTGSYGAELALILEAARRRKTPSVAVSDQLTGQAVAYAMSENALIGEEIFVSTPYLSEDGARAAEAVIMDVLRWLLVLAILGGVAATLANNGG